MNTHKTKDSQIARWANLVEEYDIEVRHRKGEKMEHADALSRAPTGRSEDTEATAMANRFHTWIALTEQEYVLSIQYSDPELRKMIDDIRQKDDAELTHTRCKELQNYRVENGCLYRRVCVDHDDRWLYVVPKSMRKSIVVKFHDLGGHFGVDRTVSRILTWYWFAGIRRYVRVHVRRCAECVLTKIPAGRRPGLLHPIPPGRRPFETIHMDHLGPFVRSERGNAFLLVMIDDLTKYLRLYPAPDTRTEGVVAALGEFILEYGLPERIISDRGTCFTSMEFETYCKQRGVKHVLTSVRHPRANGQVERTNRTVVPVIQVYLKEEYEWDLHLKTVERDCNTAVNKTTNKTPFELLYNYIPRYEDGVLRMLTKSTEVTEVEEKRELARKKICDAQEKWKQYHDKRHYRATKYDVGEVVFIRRPPKATGESTKTQAKYRGPLVVTEVLSSDTYRVAQIGGVTGRRYATTAHVTQLKGFGRRSEQVAEGESEDEPSSEGDESPHGNSAMSDGEPEVAEITEDREEGGRPRRTKKKPSYLRDYDM